MTTIGRYLRREIYRATLVALFAFIGLFSFFDLVGELDDLGRGGYRLQHALVYVALSVPGHVYELFPVVVLIGTLFALASLASSSEYTVMRVSGLSPLRAVRTLLWIGLGFVAFILLIGEIVAPEAEQAAKRLRLQSMGTGVYGDLRSGIWVKSEGAFVNIREVTPDTTLRGVRIFSFDQEMRLRSIAQAATGRYNGNSAWRLDDVVETRFDGDGATVENKPSIEWPTQLTPEILSVVMVDPDRMSAWRLYEYVRHLAANNQSTERYEIALWHKLAYPFAALVMMALALPFAYVQVRSGTVGVKLFAGVMLGVVFHFLNSLFSSLGVLQSWPPFATAFLPAAIFLVMAMLMMWSVERR